MTSRYQILPRGVFDHQTRTIIEPTDSDPNWVSYREWLTAGGVPLPPDSVATDDLATAKEKRCAEIDAYAAGLRNKIIAGRSVGEMASWTLKLLDAMSVAAAQPNPFAPILGNIQTALGLPTLPTSYNDAIGKVRGITESEHVSKVLTQAIPFLAAEAAIDGSRGKHCDAVNAMTDVRDITTYNWHTGWPTL